MARGNRAPLNINGSQYGWSSLSIVILGTPVWGVNAINFKMTQEAENYNGLSTMAVGQGWGDFSTEGSITLAYDEYFSIIKAAKAQGYEFVSDIPVFDILITLTAPGDSTKFTNWIVKDCSFLEWGVELSRGDINGEIEVPILFTSVDIVI